MGKGIDLSKFTGENKKLLKEDEIKKAGRNPILDKKKKNKIVSVYLNREEFDKFEKSRLAVPRSAFLYKILKENDLI
ncbi:MAG: hypothetical protein JRJ49_03535 [Deltaproteobacteria bacterium]|nr:hypothetical protein [Deltaproteobacteria bacterium]